MDSPAGAPANESLFSPRHRALVFGLTLIVTFTAFEGLAVVTILPAVTRDLGGLSLYGWVFSAFLLSDLVGIVLSGAQADQHSPARPFAVGVLLFVTGLLIAGAAPSMPILVAGRVVQGLGAGANFSMAYVAIGRGLPDYVKPKMLAIMSSAWVIPGLIGPALAGWIADHLGWRWVFAGLAPLPLLAATMALPAL
ncbi:MAG TPA: MFS transporter, partial [Chthonomonadaceae bacterium]|nr:MFS transporter [Chthonomonadaceae bacterium]